MTRHSKATSPPSSSFVRVDSLTLPPGAIIVRDNGDRWLVGSVLNGGLMGRQLLTDHRRGELSEIKAEWLVRVEGVE